MRKLPLAAALLSWAPAAKRGDTCKLSTPAGDANKAAGRIDRRSARFAFAGIALALAAGQAFGGTCPSGTIYATGFENPPFATGPLLGQDGWGRAVPILSPDAAVVSTDLFFPAFRRCALRVRICSTRTSSTHLLVVITMRSVLTVGR
jgi:hypothetical protein